MNVYGKLGESGMIFDKPYRTPQGYIKMIEERPTTDHVAQEDGTWVISQEAIDAQYEADLATLDPLLSHIYRHDFNGETEAKARAERQYAIAQAEVLEKYGKGSTVLITENRLMLPLRC